MTAAAPSDRSSAVARRLLWCVLLVAGLALALRLLPRPRTIDDAYITFRYARNIVEGQGFVYNPGVRTLGTTTPLYTLLMAAIGAITGSEAYPWFALGVNALADAITAGLLAVRNNEDELAGVLFGFATIKPQVVLVLLVFIFLWSAATSLLL